MEKEFCFGKGDFCDKMTCTACWHFDGRGTELREFIDYWENVCELNAKQERKGVEKYGQRLEENVTLSREQRVEHLEEELIDALKYCEHLKMTFRDSLTANDYQRMAMRTAGEYETNLAKIRNAVYGLNGEAGEVIDILKKHEFQGHELNKESMIDELGDVLWYAALLADALGVTLEDVMNHNVEKLKARYPDGFDKARSINREK
jgi:NTP pyrophosphatase (non-canonical NTP hydrolase)